MTTYDPPAVLDAITANAIPVILIGGLSIVAMFGFFIEAARMGARDRVYPMALWMTVLWWPHDGSYLLHLSDWWGRYDHWFMQLFWFAIVVTFLAECTYVAQTVRYGRNDLSPGLSRTAHTVRVFGALACGVISWTLLKGAISDPLYLLSFMATLLWGAPSGSALLGRRPDGQGQSVLEWIGFLAMALFYSVVSIGFFGGGFFREWPYVSLCVASCVWAAVHLVQVWRSPAPLTSFHARRQASTRTVLTPRRAGPSPPARSPLPHETRSVPPPIPSAEQSTVTGVSLAARTELLGSATRITGHWLRERVTPSRPISARDVPPSPSALTTDWLTDVLCRDHPGARVVDFAVGSGSDGTSARRPLTVAYNGTGQQAGLPTALYTKSSSTLLTRLFCGLNHIMVYEGQFYLRIRPELNIETPVAYHAGYDVASGRSLLIMEDVATTRGVTFADPTVTGIDRARADDMVDLMASYHGAYWDSPRLDTEFTWLLDASAWQRRLNDMMGVGRMFQNGLKRARELMPASIVDREKQMWPALLRSLDLEAAAPRTLVHQDTHSRNWYVTGEGRMGLYDWQCNAKGSWALDVPYALGCGLRVEDRRAWERDLLHRYLDRLRAEGAPAPSFATAWLSYRQQIMHGLAFWLATIGRTVVQPELQPHEVCIANIRRLSQAAADLDTLDAIGAG